MHMVTTTYGDGATEEGKAVCLAVVPTMVHVIWREIRKVGFEADTVYGSDTPLVMVGQYLWGTLQMQRVMDYLLWNQFIQHLEVDLHITIFLLNTGLIGWRY